MSTEPAEPIVVPSSALARFDARVAAAVARIPRRLAPAMWVATALGYPAVESVPLVVTGVVTEGAVRTACWAMAVSMLVPTVLKHTIRRRRPVSDYVQAMVLPSPSFPSGHAYSAVAAFGLYGFFAVTRLSTPVAVLAVLGCVVWVLWVSVSRLFFRAHFASDVVGGWLIGAAVLAGVLLVAQP